jgi:hypothetical protein
MMLTAGLVALPMHFAAADPGPHGLVQIQTEPGYDEPSVSIWTDRDWYAIGDPVRVTVTVDRPGFVTVYNIDAEGYVRRLTDDPGGVWVTPGRPLVLPQDRRARLLATGPGGEEELVAVASRFRFVRTDMPSYGEGPCRERCLGDRDRFVHGINARLVSTGPIGDRSVARTTFYVEPLCHSSSVVRLAGGIYIDIGFAIPAGAMVYVDGIYWGMGPDALYRLECGSHRISLKTREGRKFTRTVDVRPLSHYRFGADGGRKPLAERDRYSSGRSGKKR